MLLTHSSEGLCPDSPGGRKDLGNEGAVGTGWGPGQKKGVFLFLPSVLPLSPSKTATDLGGSFSDSQYGKPCEVLQVVERTGRGGR